MLFMLIETYRNADPVPVYRRVRERGRQTMDGVTYLGSWATKDLTRCFQIMDCDDRGKLDQWIALWDDLVEFEVIDVITSAEAAEAVARRYS
jgi:hypothetical protein